MLNKKILNKIQKMYLENHHNDNIKIKNSMNNSKQH
jgi:hypothetical protein